MRPKNPPPAEYHFGWADPPRSGNAINGLGLAKKIRPSKIFPEQEDDYEWRPFWAFMQLNYMPWSKLMNMMRAFVESAKFNGTIASRRQSVDDPAAMASTIKDKARKYGAAIVGITNVKDDLLLYEGDPSCPYNFAILLGIEQDRQAMLQAPQPPASAEVMKAYLRCGKIANKLAAHIRALGWPAEGAAFGRDILMIPSAINAGLGQLGKHGSLISKELGSNFRIAMVLTDLPLIVDEAVDIGVEDVCLYCQRCTKDCPAGAISDEKKIVRGEKKWYVDYDKCAYYFVLTSGCNICVEVCPWSEPGRGKVLSSKIMKKRIKETLINSSTLMHGH